MYMERAAHTRIPDAFSCDILTDATEHVADAGADIAALEEESARANAHDAAAARMLLTRMEWSLTTMRRSLQRWSGFRLRMRASRTLVRTTLPLLDGTLTRAKC